MFEYPQDPVGSISWISTEPEGLLLTIPRSSDRRVGVEYSPDLTPGSWIDIGNFIFASDQIGNFIDDDYFREGRTRGYYRAFLR
jgi:hypothetical protein